jgi:hypothetical protein
MFFNVFNRALLCAGIFALSACGGGEAADGAPNTSLPLVHPAPQQVASPTTGTGAGAGTGTGAGTTAQGGGATRSVPPVSAAERDAEQLRMVPYEQAFAIEMQRRAQERPEYVREQGEPAHAPAQAACVPGADPARPSGCAATPPAAAAGAPGLGL